MRNPDDYAERLALMQTAATLMASDSQGTAITGWSEAVVLARAKRAIRIAEIIYAEVMRTDPLDK